jgi:RNA-directed DNA polymerase
MSAITPAGAASHVVGDWHAINWQAVNQNVRRLQARIVKATKEGRWGKVKALQRLLTHSFSGKALAVRRVTENQGKRTPGVDHETWETPEKKATAIQTLRRRGYQPRPLRRVYIPKSNGKKRPLGIPTMRDRAMQALYLLALEPIAETTGDPDSYGFRPTRATADAMAQCFNILGKSHSPEWVLEGDIKSCFDRISHDWLLAHVPMDKAILRAWLKAGFMENHILYPTDAGTPQGGIISPVLANLALDGLERILTGHFPQPHRGPRPKVHLVRYADDFIVTAQSKEMLEQEVRPLIEQFMRERGLELSSEKTCITHIENGFDFLGQNVRKYRNGKRRVLLIKPSSKSITALLEKVRGIVKTNRQAPAGKLVLALNPIIKGWALYHRHVVSKKVFNDVDHAIFDLLWQWARRRHRNKSAGWVKKKYYRASGGYSWVFHGEANGEDQCLTRAVKVAIVRHVKVKGEANPYDPAWEVYFEKRLGVKMADTLQGRRQLLHLWQEQGGICPVCNQKITELTGWHNHHVTWRSLGGPDTAGNRVLLHPNCHRQVHNLNISVSKPRPERAFERLEPYEGKLSRTVLRGADSGNTARLPDHPSGDPSPSPEDVAVTRTLVEAGKLLDIQLLDHIILGATGLHVSLKDRGLGFT